jgi:hypothetical protein
VAGLTRCWTRRDVLSVASERIAGLKGVGAVVGVAPETVIALASRPWDPLPLRRLEGSVWGWGPYIQDWDRRREDLDAWRRRRPRGLPGLPFLAGWEAIAERVGAGVSVDTAARWARFQDRPLPVIGIDLPAERLIGDDGLARVWIYQTALRDWLQGRDMPYRTGEARPREKATEKQLNLFG